MPKNSLLSRALRNYNMITGSVTAIRWAKMVDQPLKVRSITLKHTPGAQISHYTMVDCPDVEKPVGTASDQVYADLNALAMMLKDAAEEGVTVETITGGTEVDEDTGEVFGKTILRVSFPEPYPVLMLTTVETKNAGREVFKVVAYEPTEAVTEMPAPDTTGVEEEAIPGGAQPDFGPEPVVPAGRSRK